ncbi:hypothetical protein MCHLDSM_06214 [Mycolicibacterium chlorophenolicum]|uniref:Uncharacterized protein n=1 Tax=Mycolicibacterium chlorophenolicum TaxID=37916 RepID=A0A0J6Y6L4_9MYCO|nr:hypothetical protein MCHLDSM_06214 [Mycolicibacterium chlorophenolicum]
MSVHRGCATCLQCWDAGGRRKTREYAHVD